MSITDYLLQHSAARPISFHMPGHKGSRLFRRLGYDAFLDNMADMDITEIPGADNLFQAEGVIAETMSRYRRLYESRQTYLLVNGSSSGLIAAIMATCDRGGEVVVARNSHKSIFNGISMAGVKPVYAYPEIVQPYGISGPLSPAEVARCLKAHPSAAAMILPSPNYYGICSDIASIADVVHKAGKVLIVDQAHGAHLKFFAAQSPAAAAIEGLTPGASTEDAATAAAPASTEDAATAAPAAIVAATAVNEAAWSLAAEDQGADVVIASTHKTLASFTESAVANIMTDRVDFQRMEDALGQMETTSPSYILMASLDVNADILEKHGAPLFDRWRADIDRFYQVAEGFVPGLRIMEHPMLDRTKINLDMSAYGLSGHDLEQALMERNIWVEMVTGDIVMCLTGIGNEWADYERLLEALKEIAGERRVAGGGDGANGTAGAGAVDAVTADGDDARASKAGVGAGADGDYAGADGVRIEGEAVAPWSFPMLEQRGIPTERIESQLGDAVGKVCARAIIPYPPGIPIVCPGEVLTEEICRYVAELRERGQNVFGVSSEGTVSVGR